MDDALRYKEVRQTLLLVLAANLLVAFLKGIFGFLSNSLGMVADSIHSFFDSSSNIVGLIAMKISSKPPDECHPYGHRKSEILAALIIALLLLLTAFEVVGSAVGRIREPMTPKITTVTVAVMLFTIAVNWRVSRYEHKKGERLRNTILIADSMHTRSDIYASLSVLAGFVLIRFGYPVADPLVAIIVVLMILRIGVRILREASSTLMDASTIDSSNVIKVAESVYGVKSCHNVRSRGTRGEAYMDLHIICKSGVPLEKAHEISHEVEKRLKKKFKEIKDVTVHMEPED